jgi:hypothetical protein
MSDVDHELVGNVGKEDYMVAVVVVENMAVGEVESILVEEVVLVYIVLPHTVSVVVE